MPAAGSGRGGGAAPFGVDRRWNWDELARPYGDRRFTDGADYQRWLLDHLRSDVAEARRGNVRSPLKAALDVLRDLRNEIRLVVDHGGITGDSYRDELAQWYTPTGSAATRAAGSRSLHGRTT